jgi:hypothetical protein
MNMQVIHLLASTPTGIDHGAKAIGQTLFSRQFWGQQQYFSQQVLIPGMTLNQGIHMPFWNDHEVHRSHRVDVVKRKDILIFINLPAGQLTLADPAKNAIAHDAVS